MSVQHSDIDHTGLTGVGSGGGYDEGTSFPVSPSTGDKFFHNTSDMLFFYDGTRWLCTCPHWVPMVVDDFGVHSANATAARNTLPFAGQFGIWLERFYISLYVVTTNTGGAYWTATFKTWDGATGPTARGSGLNTSAHAADLYVAQSESLAVALTGHETCQVDIAKTGSPGSVIFTAAFTCRVIGT